MPLLPLKPTGQSRRGVIRSLEAQVHLLIRVISRFIQMIMPLLPLKPMGQYAVIEPSALRAAKAFLVE
jgi:hypothetical protein